MGENAIDPLLETAVEQRTPDGRRFERSDALALVGRVVQSFGRAALPAVEGLTDSRDRDVRRLVLDYFISLGEEPAFERLLVHFPAIELLHRLNEAEPEPLRALVADAREDGLLLGELLRDPVFRRELDVLFAIPEAREPDALCAVLEQRGPSRLLTLALLDQVSVAELRGPVARLLHSFGPQILDELVSAYADHERSAADRQAIGAQLTAIGPEIVHPVCRWIGPAASAMDEDWIELLGTLGSPASRSLSAAFEQSASGDGQRVTNRRLVILRAMAAAGARHALQRLRRAERDPDLLDHIEEALRRPPMDDEPSLGRPQPEDPA